MRKGSDLFLVLIWKAGLEAFNLYRFPRGVANEIVSTQLPTPSITIGFEWPCEGNLLKTHLEQQDFEELLWGQRIYDPGYFILKPKARVGERHCRGRTMKVQMAYGYSREQFFPRHPRTLLKKRASTVQERLK